MNTLTRRGAMLVLVTAVLAACGGGNDADPAGNPAVVGPGPLEAPPDEPAVLQATDQDVLEVVKAVDKAGREFGALWFSKTGWEVVYDTIHHTPADVGRQTCSPDLVLGDWHCASGRIDVSPSPARNAGTVPAGLVYAVTGHNATLVQDAFSQTFDGFTEVEFRTEVEPGRLERNAAWTLRLDGVTGSYAGNRFGPFTHTARLEYLDDGWSMTARGIRLSRVQTTYWAEDMNHLLAQLTGIVRLEYPVGSGGRSHVDVVVELWRMKNSRPLVGRAHLGGGDSVFYRVSASPLDSDRDQFSVLFDDASGRSTIRTVLVSYINGVPRYELLPIPPRSGS